MIRDCDKRAWRSFKIELAVIVILAAVCAYVFTMRVDCEQVDKYQYQNNSPDKTCHR